MGFVCQLCGRKIDGTPKKLPMGDSFLNVCDFCYSKHSRAHAVSMELKIQIVHPLLLLRHSPLAILTMRSITKEAVLPLGIVVEREEKKEGEGVGLEGINWEVLVGAEPIDELKEKGVHYVLTAKFAEDQGAVTAREVAEYLAQLANTPELEKYLERFRFVNIDYARKILDDLANMGIVKKEAKKGERGANIYDYFGTEKSWRKE